VEEKVMKPEAELTAISGNILAAGPATGFTWASRRG